MVKKLDKIDSLELFSYHAFKKTMPPERFRELSVGFVTYAGGLPLALKVLGSSLRGRTHVSFWNAKLEKVRKIPENEIQKILQLSYDELSDETHKTIFLDIVFFFVGKDKDVAVHIFESCDFFPEVGIPILVDRCLIIIDENNKFQMHNLIQDMGREVIREESEHGKYRRLHLCQEYAIQTLQNLEGPNKVEVLILDLAKSTKKHLSAKIFKKLPNLKLLKIIDAHDIKDDFKNCFNELRCIQWSNCPWTHLPSSFRPQKLVSFDMPCNQFKTLWKDHMPLVSLKTMNVSYSKYLKTTPDFRNLKTVEKLLFRGCKSLLKVHPSIGELSNLDHLDLSECNNLEELPEPIGKLIKLGRLDFSGCVNLKRLPEPIKQLTNLGHLDLRYCYNLKHLPEQLGDVKGLKMLDASYTAIEQLPDSIVHLKELVELKLYKCKKLNKLPEQFGNMEGLMKFDAGRTAIEQLPDSIVHLKELVELRLYSCKKLRKLPEQLGKMQCMKELNALGTAIEELPDSIKQLSKLKVLNLMWCNKLKYVRNSRGNLTSLEDLQLNLADTDKKMKLDSLNLKCNIRLCLPMILNFSSLRTLDLTDEGHNFSSSEPFSLSKLSNLEFLALTNLGGTSFPELPLNLEHLYVLDMYAKVEQLPDLSSFKQLRTLHIERCSNLQSFPQLPPHLQSLYVEECTSLQDVSDLSMLKELSDLSFTRCSSLKLISLKESSLQVRGIHRFNAILPNREIPEWFNYKSIGCTVSFDIPPTFKGNFLGVAFWVVYRCKSSANRDDSFIRGVITNKTEGRTMNHHICVRTDITGELKSSVKCTRGMDIYAKSGDRIKVSFQNILCYDNDGVEVATTVEAKVEMCGVHVIHKTISPPF